jgi:hypothetical protein
MGKSLAVSGNDNINYKYIRLKNYEKVRIKAN